MPKGRPPKSTENEDSSPQKLASEVVTESVEAESSRPKRVARKSKLLSSNDYEVMLPGVKQEEPDDYQTEYLPKQTAPQPKRLKMSAKEVPKTLKSPRRSIRIAPPLLTEEKTGLIQTIAEDDEDAGPPVVEREEVVLLGPATSASVSHSVPELGAEVESYVEDYTLPSDGEDTENLVTPGVRRRGRPPKSMSNRKPNRGFPVVMRTPGERAISRRDAEKYNSYAVKVFEDEINMTPEGDCFATVISGCLSYLLRKEKIIDLLTNPEEIAMIREGGWYLDKPPRLPPLVDYKVCFAFYVDGTKINHVKDLSTDELKPWSSTDVAEGEAVVKPNVRRHMVHNVDGQLVPVKNEGQEPDFYLTEYSAWLPRLLRLRKKIFYLTKDGQIHGNVLILYDYTCPGPPPFTVNQPHGNDMLKGCTDNDYLDVVTSPFEEDVIEGPRGEKFCRVKPTKLGWVNQKKIVLRYLINDIEYLEQQHLINRKVPYLPPLIETTGVFVYFASANCISNHLHHTGDGLSPWTATAPGDPPGPRVRSVRRPVSRDEQGVISISKERYSNCDLVLVENLTILARCPRLRKRVLYIQKNNSIPIGVVCFVYEFIKDGELPEIIKSGSKAWERRQTELLGIINPPKKPGQRNTQRGMGVKIETVGGDTLEEDFIDVEEEEEVTTEITDSSMIDHVTVVEEEDEEEQDVPDCLADGWDPEFQDELLLQDSPEPYFEEPRMLESNHVYLTIRHKRLVNALDSVLDHIANSNFIEERGLLNYSKPMHPPLVRNARAYAFFVAGSAIFPHDINRDDLSPWSHNGSPENPTCYRTKVRKIGLSCEESTHFRVRDADYKICPFHLVCLYSINPREPRLRKKIYYVMETESRVVISHALIIYDYHVEGSIPKLHGAYVKRSVKRHRKTVVHDVENDVSDLSESEKENPFVTQPQEMEDGSVYMQLNDTDFLMDKNRILHYLVNKPQYLESLGCLNNRVPLLPPDNTGKAAYVFFIDGTEVDSRTLTADALAPWSDAGSSAIPRRPKSGKVTLALNRDSQLRVTRANAQRPGDMYEFQLNIYTATLPRCPRLKKKVVYVMKNGGQFGHAMISYIYTEPGPTVICLNPPSMLLEEPRLSGEIREEARRLLMDNPVHEAARILTEKSGQPISTKQLYGVRRELRKDMGIDTRNQWDIKSELLAANYDVGWSTQPHHSHPVNDAKMMVDEHSIHVSHTEEIHDMVKKPGTSRPPNMNRPQPPFQASNKFNSSRAVLKTDALWRMAKATFGTASEFDTYDMVFKMLLERNEGRLLTNIQQAFGIEIMESNGMDETIEVMDVNGEMMTIQGGQVIEEVVQDDLQQPQEEEVVVEMEPTTSTIEPKPEEPAKE